MIRFLIFFFFIATVTVGQTRVLTLEQCLKIGMENSNMLKISRAKVTTAVAKVRETGSQMLPRLNLSASYTKLSDVPPFQVNVPISPTPITIQDAILDNYNLKFSILQPLFTGRRLWSLRRAAKLNNDAAQSQYSNDANEMALNIHYTFWNYYKAKQILEVVEENCRQLEKLVSDTKYFLQNGLATKNDLLKLEVQYANSKLRKIESQNNVKVAQALLNKTLGYPMEDSTDISVTGMNINLKDYHLDNLIEEAINQREQLKASQMRIKAGEKFLNAARSGWFPSIYLFGDYYYNRPNQRFMPLQDEFNDSWDVGINLSWDLWNWGFTSSQTVQAKQQLIQIKAGYSQIKDDIEMEVYQAYLNIISAKDKIDVNKISVEQAEENYRITNEKYNQQLASSSDLIDAEVMLLNAKTQFTHARVDYQLAKIKLEKAVGRNIY